MKLIIGFIAVISMLMTNIVFADVVGPGGPAAGVGGRGVLNHAGERKHDHRKFERNHPDANEAVAAHAYHTR